MSFPRSRWRTRGFTFAAKLEKRPKGGEAAKNAPIEEIVITRVDARSPAGKAGLSVGKKILQVGEVKLVGLSATRLREEFDKKSLDGKISLVVMAKEMRSVVIDFRTTPLNAKEPNKAGRP